MTPPKEDAPPSSAGANGAPAVAAGDAAFVIGPGRSGTTLLYKLVCMHPQVAYLSNFEHRLPWIPPSLTGRLRLRRYSSKLRYWFADGNAYVVRRPLASRLMPSPVEGESVYRYAGLPLYPEPGYRPDERVAGRLRAHFSRLQQATGARVVVSKRTANNRRIPALESIFPAARYVNLVRDGREVASSLARVDWWNDHPLWWDERRRTPAEAAAEGEDMLELCARNWVEEMNEIEQGLEAVPPARVLNVRFEELVSAPLEQMARVTEFLGLERRRDYEWALRALNLRHRPGAWRERFDASELETVTRVQADHLERLGYAV